MASMSTVPATASRSTRCITRAVRSRRSRMASMSTVPTTASRSTRSITRAVRSRRSRTVSMSTRATMASTSIAIATASMSTSATRRPRSMLRRTQLGQRHQRDDVRDQGRQAEGDHLVDDLDGRRRSCRPRRTRHSTTRAGRRLAGRNGGSSTRPAPGRATRATRCPGAAELHGGDPGGTDQRIRDGVLVAYRDLLQHVRAPARDRPGAARRSAALDRARPTATQDAGCALRACHRSCASGRPCSPGTDDPLRLLSDARRGSPSSGSAGRRPAAGRRSARRLVAQHGQLGGAPPRSVLVGECRRDPARRDAPPGGPRSTPPRSGAGSREHPSWPGRSTAAMHAGRSGASHTTSHSRLSGASRRQRDLDRHAGARPRGVARSAKTTAV